MLPVSDSIHLVAIHAETPQIEARWFGEDAEGAQAWAKERNRAGYNLYWTVNRVTPGLHKKPTKADIVSCRFAHVDCDPGPGWDRNHTLAALKGCNTPPTTIIDSGNGLQALWKLASDPGVSAVEDLNRRLIRQFGGDPACWNVDRLLRVPETMNIPTPKKRAQGRFESWARVIHSV